jgi:glycosyltransferase involved in cell wall biosynthesis
MRILALNWQDRKHPYAGGAEVHLHEILSRLGARGHEITLLCCRFGGLSAEEHYDNMRVIRKGWRTLFNWGLPHWTKELLAESNHDVVIDDINKIPFFSARFVKKPLVAVVHHLFGGAIFHEVNPIAASYVYLAESLVPRAYRRVPTMVVSESTRDDLVARGMNQDMLRVIHNGIDPSRYRPDPLQTKSPEPMLAYVGRLKRYKSIEHFLAAGKALKSDYPGLMLHIVGAGNDEQRLRGIASRWGIADMVTFHGFAAFEAKTEIMRRSWVVVCPSLKEGWGLTNIEANACGTPVVCADVPGLRDSARDGRTGFLYPYGDVAALTERLRRLLADSDLRLRLAQGALEWAGHFSWDRAAIETEQVLERVIAGDKLIGRAN